MSRRRALGCAAVAIVFLSLFFQGSILTAGQEPSQRTAARPPEREGAKPGARAEAPKDEHAATSEPPVDPAIEKMFADFDLKPHGWPAVPDNPPPHEGAMITYPHILQPPDLVMVEVLEALPGRPISGERMVRCDGTISMGFYGDVHVAGLTVKQAKVKIIQHLRKFLTDEMLGLYELKPEGLDQQAGAMIRPGPPDRAPDMPEDGKLFQFDGDQKTKPEASKPRTVPSRLKVRSVRQGHKILSYYGRSRPGAQLRLLGRFPERDPEDQKKQKTEEPAKSVKVPIEAGGQVTISIEIQAQEKREKEEAAPEAAAVTRGAPIHPADSDRVFFDVTAYNSNNYYIQGDVASPGMLPFTGFETVLDALQFANGLTCTAEPRDIHLIRPARGGKPAKDYKVDLEAIRDRGDVTANYQIFPGDRLVIGRNDVLKKTIQIDRLAGAMQTVVNSIMQESFMLRAHEASSPENHDLVLKNLVEFWIEEMKRPDGVQLDEQTIRDALLRRLRVRPQNAEKGK
ncbi:MAG: polysaccharide biosynthesis/export family protein [Isosphaeraceae bacterium]